LLRIPDRALLSFYVKCDEVKTAVLLDGRVDRDDDQADEKSIGNPGT